MRSCRGSSGFKTQVVLVAIITTIGLLRGLWWVAVTPVWSPIDEQAHYDFVESLGRGEGLPIVGKTRVHADVLELVKQDTPTVRQSYEAAQPPLYYAAMAPVWRGFDGASTRTRVSALRVASLLLSLALIPLVWLLGRELFPRDAAVGVAGAALVAVLSGVNGNFAIVANDGLMAVLAAATLLVVARTMQRGLTPRRALVTGALVGLTILTKTTALSLVFVVAIGFGLAAGRNRQRVGEFIRCGAIAGAAAAALLAPWLVFNHAHYGGLTAAKQLDAITGSLQSDPPFNLHGLMERLRQGTHGFFDAQLLSVNATRAAMLWFATTAGLGGAALVQMWRRSERRDVATLAWLLATWPIAFVTMAVVILHLSGGRSDIAGRHLYVALPALAVAIACAARRVFGEWMAVALSLVVAVALTFEVSDASWFVRVVDGSCTFVPQLWAVTGWAGVIAALTIARWGKRHSGLDAPRSSSADASLAPSVTP